MALTPGTRLGVYQIVAAIGEGGMGAVYRATDTSLGRQVAIEVLPDAFAQDAERLARFEREAKTLAALNHPNISAIYAIERSAGVTALVMELVEGDDLSQRIAHGAIPIDEALPIAKQIADALEAAHEQGIIHRDLKPANIKVRGDGQVKVLDFGLAKAMEPVGAMSPSLSMSPTLTTPAMTQAGMILGTAAYMSPEQARGRTVDKRADIWAFGCVLFEMLTGRQPFPGDDISHVLARVIERDPDFDALPPSVPARVSQALRLCLRKDPKLRVGDIRDARLALEGAFETAAVLPAASSTSSGSGGRRAFLAAVAVALLGMIALAIPALRHLREPAPVEPMPVRFQIPAPGSAPAEMFRLSPDGHSLAFVAPDSRGVRLWVHSLDSLEARALAGTDGASYPFWSPDNRQLGFFSQGKLKRIAVAGGPPETVCDAATGRGGTWNRNGEILFSPGPVGALYRVSAAGGMPTPATKNTDLSNGQRFPEFLPDGRHFLYSVQARTEAGGSGLYVGSLDGGEPRRLLSGDSSAAYSPPITSGGSGLLLFRRDDTLMAQPLDPERLQTIGDVFPVAEHVSETVNIGAGAFSVSATGVLAFRSVGQDNRELVWIDRAGRRGAAMTEPFGRATAGSGLRVALSPDEHHVAFTALKGNQEDLWLLNLAQGGTSRFTFGPGGSSAPVWSPDGTRLVYSNRVSTGTFELHQKLATSGDAKVLLHLDGVTNIIPWDWSSDGKFIVYSVTTEKTATDLWLLPMTGDPKPVRYLETPASEIAAKFSPDSRWLAYVSNESGQNQVYVQPVPATGAKWQVSTTGGDGPEWRRDGTELFYQAPSGTLMAVPVKIASSFEAGTPAPLPLTVPYNRGGSSYVPTRDGQRFLVNVPVGGEAAVAPPITVVLNWQAGLRK